MKKRFAATWMVLLLLCAVGIAMPTAAAATRSGNCGTGVTWSLDAGVLTIRGSGAMADYTENSGGYAPWYDYRYEINTCRVENGVTRIGNNAFNLCYYMTEVTLPASLTSIGDQAFLQTGLGRVTIPAQVTSIGTYAFSYCRNMQAITVASGNPAYVSQDGALFNKAMTTLYHYPLASARTSYTVPSSVTMLYCTSFAQATHLTNLWVPNPNCWYMGYTFYGDTGMTVHYMTGSQMQQRVAMDTTGFTNFAVWQNAVVPGAPTYLWAETRSSASVGLGWQPAANAAGYEIWRSKAGQTMVKVATVTGGSTQGYIDKNLASATQYTYQVRAYSAEGLTGEWSQGASATTNLTTPKITAVTPVSYGTVKVKWNMVSNATGYLLFRATSENGPYTQMKTVNGTSATLGGMTNGKTYWFKVQAYMGNGELRSVYSVPVSGKAAPAAPGGVKTASVSYRTVKVSWQTVAGATGYKVYRSTSPEGTYTQVAKVASATATYTLVGDNTTGKTYYYKVRAYRTASGAVSDGILSQPVTGKAVPSTVTGLQAAPTVAGVHLSWNSVSGASGYAVYRAAGAGGSYTRVKTIAGTATTDTQTKTGSWRYKVRAYRVVNGVVVWGAYSSVTNTAY